MALQGYIRNFLTKQRTSNRTRYTITTGIIGWSLANKTKVYLLLHPKDEILPIVTPVYYEAKRVNSSKSSFFLTTSLYDKPQLSES